MTIFHGPNNKNTVVVSTGQGTKINSVAETENKRSGAILRMSNNYKWGPYGGFLLPAGKPPFAKSEDRVLARRSPSSSSAVSRPSACTSESD